MATQVIDGKIVEMKFDNSDFEKNVAQSMSTLDKLKQALNFDSAKGLESVGKASKKFDMSGVGSAVDAVQAKFSALQVIGMTALSELTKSAMKFGSTIVHSVIDPIKTGGMKRAMNIEQAKFQLEGLGVAWSDIEEDINYGVKDTAYGLDVAAKAASQLTASGVQMGDEMKSALRGISGVAAMTSSSYEEISPIFTTVAGQGKLMTMQLRQLESRGLNAAATLAKYLNVTEAEIREMVTDGKIDFQTFADAMDDAFGAHAKDANKTFTGAMSNVKAAMSRIGANFATPYMENMRLIYVSLIDVINGINKALKPTYELASRIMERLQKGLTNFLGSTGFEQGYISILNALRNAFYALILVLEPIKKAFRDIFPKQDFNTKFKNATKAIEDFTEKLFISEETAEKIGRAFKGLFAVFDIVGMAFKALFDVIKPMTGGLKDILGSILDFAAGIGDYLVQLRDGIKANDTFGKAFSAMADKIIHAKDTVVEAFNKMIDAVKKFKAEHFGDVDFSGLTNFIDSVKNRIKSFGSVGEVLSSVFGQIKKVLSTFEPLFKSLVKGIADSIGILLNGFGEAFKGGKNDPFTTFLNIFTTANISTMIVNIAQAFSQLGKSVKLMGGLSPILTTIKYGLQNTFLELQANLKADTIMKLAKAIAVFAGSLLVLSLINPGRLATSLVAVEVLIETLKKFVAFIETITKSSSIKQSMVIESLARSMVTLGTAVLVLALAVKVMAGLDFLGLLQGLGATVILIKVLSDQAILLSNIDTKVMKGASTMIALGIAVRILASAVKAMASLSLTELVKGLGATVILMYALAGAVKLMDGTKIVGAATAILALSVAMLILTKSIKELGSIPLEQLAQGLAAAVIGIMSMSLALTLIGTYAKGGTLVAAAVAILALSAGLAVFASVVKTFSEIPLEQLAQGVLAVVIGIAAMTAALLALTLVGSSGELLAASASILIMAEGLNILSKAIERLGQMKVGDLLKAFITLVAVIGGFALAASVLSPLLPVMAALAGIVALLGVGILALGAGVTMLSVGLMTLATACTTVVANLGAILTIIAALIPAIAIALANGIIQFVVVIGNGAAQIVDAVVALGKSILEGITTLLPDLFDLIKTALIELVDLTVEMVPYFVEGAIKLVTGLIEGITRSLPALIAAGTNMMLTFTNGLAADIRKNTPLMIAAMDNLMSALIDAGKMWLSHFVEQGGNIVHKLIEGIKRLLSSAKSAGAEVLKNAINGIKDGIKGVVQLGKDFVDGFIEGIKSAPGKIAEAAKGLVTDALNAIKSAQRSNSPAKETRAKGNDFSDGYAIGISDGREDVQHAAKDIADAALDEVKEGTDESVNVAATGFSAIDGYLARGRQALDKMVGIDKKAKLSTEDLRKEQIAAKKAAKDQKEATDDLSKSQENYAAATGKASKATKDQKSVMETVKDTISNQLDMFTKFEAKTEMTAQQMLDNMRSNLDGFASWSAKLASLAERGIDKSLYQKLAEMGPKSYEQVNAFAQMTDDQLQQANDMWQQSITLPDSIAQTVGAGYDKAGQGAVKGLTNALSAGEAQVKSEGAKVGQAAVDGVTSAEGLDEHSPSKKTFMAGQNAIKGLNEGMKGFTSFVRSTATTIGRFIVTDMSNAMAPGYFSTIGSNAISGLASGMNFMSQSAYNSAYNIGTNVMIGLKQGLEDNEWRPLEKARNIAQSIRDVIAKALKVESPSKVMIAIGRYVSEGLAIGMEEAAYKVYNASEKVATIAESGIETTAGRIEDLLDSDLDLNPIITPRLDLSYIKEQMNSINAMFGNRSLAATYDQNEGNLVSRGNAQINFTQNNYSPKSLSRYEIYRQTNNQIRQLKGALA